MVMKTQESRKYLGFIDFPVQSGARMWRAANVK
jgi:hypothetical protein